MGIPNVFEPQWMRETIPHVLPVEWEVLKWGLDGGKWRHTSGMTVISGGTTEVDGKRWLHVSMARPDRLPTYEDQVAVKELFIGREKTALHVFAPRARHVNIHPNCLHLWHCLDGDVTPDFTRGGSTL